MLTLQERERLAYISGDTSALAMLQACESDLHDEALHGIKCHVDEARYQYPDEDFAARLIDRLYGLANRLRGENRDEARNIAQELEELQDSIRLSAEYGRDELRQALDAIAQLTQ